MAVFSLSFYITVHKYETFFAAPHVTRLRDPSPCVSECKKWRATGHGPYTLLPQTSQPPPSL